MIGDIGTVMWKEFREFFSGSSGGSGRGRGYIAVLVIVAIASILIPLQSGRALFTSGTPIIVDGLYLPFVILLNLVADTFAGERERHTLETLLASRLSDRAILFGKVAAATAYGWGGGLLAALIQAVVANLSQKNATPGSGLEFYPANTVVVIVVFGLLTSLLAASVGCLVSLRASSTRQAQLNLGVGFLVLVFVPFLILQLLPAQTQDDIIAQFNSADPTQLFLIIAAVLAIVDATLLSVAILRFQRARLITG